ncbi:MAG TPA: amidohydrolase family protein [Vicinamibacteria bacterium]|nr:amidohydrolase family protein [Vicinamibacteria bacterium]
MRTRTLALSLLLPTMTVAGENLSPVALGRVDAHAHFFAEAKPVLDLLERLNLVAVNVCVVDRYDKGYETVAPQQAMARHLAAVSRGRLPWIGTFDDASFASSDFAIAALSDVDRALAQGAIGVKIYKSIGMELRSTSGAYVLPDDPAFEPVFAGLEARGTTVYGHIAEPIAAWLPLDPKNPDYDYYRTNPAWHVYGRPGVPTKEAILAARDRVLERHPKLRFVGCHLGSMEEDVDAISARFDRHPGFAVDTAARVVHLMLQPREKVRAFLLRYSDRVLYGTDLGIMPGQDPVEAAKRLEHEYARDWAYFAAAGTIDVDGRKVEGLALPDPVLRRIFRENARRWLPGLAAASRP